ncbi:hypothetical protein TNCV_1717311 [Trichonephila clavipes]|nr:hypothetical protein TNCV_1717311 [Trichonephila clavipes]
MTWQRLGYGINKQRTHGYGPLIDSLQTNSNSSTFFSACEQILLGNSLLQRWSIIQKFKLACISELQAMPDHHPDVSPSTEVPSRSFRKLKKLSTMALSDLASFPPCVSPGCPHHEISIDN